MGHQSPTPPLPRKHNDGQSPESSSSDSAATAISRAKKSRYPVDDDDDGAGDRVECSGKYCRSCSAGMIADCVALCCCPCALVNLLTLVFVKVPWMVGRRCLRLGKNKNKIKSQGQTRKSKQKCKSKKKTKHCGQMSGSSSHRQRRCAVEEELPAEIACYAFGFDDREEEKEEEEDCVSSAERVWLELYQVGHLGFGRVSFSGGGVQAVQGKSN
ncbi:uncharacterized protein LOC126800125 [Argentina anserina]|uniref:uncharacterized protein LOC126800125 n=1 Tax=Argentina anserina TaxID=57926 RepID=UPI002176716A|nr:uncharacterized protein LOC126800125 [Potentilla anserina]